MKGLTRSAFFLLLFWNSCLITGSLRERDAISRVLRIAFRGNGENDITGDIITADKRLNDEDLDIALDTVDLLQRLMDADRNYDGRAEDRSGLADQDIRKTSRRQCWYCGGGTGTKIHKSKDQDKKKDDSNTNNGNTNKKINKKIAGWLKMIG